MGGISTEILTGGRLDQGLDPVARLRIEVFRAYPYLYDGSLDYEQRPNIAPLMSSGQRGVTGP